MQALGSRHSWARAATIAVVGVVLAVSGASAQRGGRGGGADAEVPPPNPGGPIYTAPTPAMNMSGVWWTESYSPKIQVVGGGELPYNDKGKTEYAKIIAGLKDGSIKDEARHLCVPDGLPRLLGDPYPFQLIQTPGQVTIVYELNHVIRIVPLNRPLPNAHELEVAPYYSGHSVAHWEGDTLVVESAGFNDKTFLDATGAPHSDAMTTVERLHKLGDTTLEDVITVNDPEMFTHPWSARFVYDLHPEVRIDDYVCGEKHRDISKVKGVVVRR
jgi:hypothetical protein